LQTHPSNATYLPVTSTNKTKIFLQCYFVTEKKNTVVKPHMGAAFGGEVMQMKNLSDQSRRGEQSKKYSTV